jgi:methanol metabolism-related c-type cytochrome
MRDFIRLAGSAVLTLPLALIAPQAVAIDDAWIEKPYTVVDGKVDFGTYNGYRRYHSHCHVCHGPDGLGSTYAPALVKSIPQIGYQGYIETVVNGREGTAVVAGQPSVMPSFAEVEDVITNIDDIYSYLKARADGALPRGRPERLSQEEDPVWQERRS